MGLACQPECSLTWAIDLQLVRDMSLQDMTWRADWCYPLVDLWAAILNVHGENKRKTLVLVTCNTPEMSASRITPPMSKFILTILCRPPTCFLQYSSPGQTRNSTFGPSALVDRISTADKKKRLWILPRLKKHWYLRHQQGRQETRLIDSDMADEEIKFYS